MTTLIIMAAGMGSRFGGLKQIEPVGPNGEIIMDYSIRDALSAGFDKVVLVIRKDFEKQFRETIGKRIEKIIDTKYVFQSADNMPEGRVKPWGTGHAVLSAKHVINTPFAVINADDFYGAYSFKLLNQHLTTEKTYVMIGYNLHNTLSENGTVSRGVCEVEDGFLSSVTEHHSISQQNDFDKDTVVSMNMFGFGPNLFYYLQQQFDEFLRLEGNNPGSEFLIPQVVDRLIKNGQEKVKVLMTPDKWYGITYKEDLQHLQSILRK